MSNSEEVGRFETFRRMEYEIDKEQRRRREMVRRYAECRGRGLGFDPVDAPDTADAADRFLREQETP